MLLALRDSYLGSLLLRNENNQYILNKREHFFLHLKLNFIWSSLQKQEAKSTLNLKTQKEGHITTAFYIYFRLWVSETTKALVIVTKSTAASKHKF